MTHSGLAHINFKKISIQFTIFSLFRALNNSEKFISNSMYLSYVLCYNTFNAAKCSYFYQMSQ